MQGSAAARKMMALADRCCLRGGVLHMPHGTGLSLTKLRHKSKEKLDGTFQVATRTLFGEIVGIPSGHGDIIQGLG